MNQNDDSMLDEFLDGKSSVNKIYRHGSKSQPPADLDEKILAQAQQAVAESPVSGHSPGNLARRPRWLVPAALAATLILGINLAYNLKDYSPDTAYSEDSAIVASPRYEAKRQQAAEQKTQTNGDSDIHTPATALLQAPARTPPASPEVEAEIEPTQDDLAYAPAPATVTLQATEEVSDTKESPTQFADAMPARKRQVAAVTDAPAKVLQRSSGFTVESQNSVEMYKTVEKDTRIYQCDLAAFGLSDLDIENQARASRHSQNAPLAWKNAIVRFADRGEYKQACLELAAFQQRYPDATFPANFPVQLNH